MKEALINKKRPKILNVVVVTQQVNELSEDVFLVAEMPLESREVELIIGLCAYFAGICIRLPAMMIPVEIYKHCRNIRTEVCALA